MRRNTRIRTALAAAALALLGLASLTTVFSQQQGQANSNLPYRLVLPNVAADSASGGQSPTATSTSAGTSSPTVTATSGTTTTPTVTATPAPTQTASPTPSPTGIAFFPPVAVPDSYVVTEDVPLVVAAPGVLANDVGLPAPQAEQQTAPQHGTLALNPNGGFTYTPDANFTGTDEFYYRATNGFAPDSIARVEFQVQPIDDPPAAVADSVTATEDVPTPLDLLANDTDIDGGTKAIASTSDPAHGSVTVTGGGSDVTYTSDLNFCGSDSFTYTLAGGSSATVSVTVNCVDDLPVAVADAATVAEDAAPTAVDVLANDTDPEGNSFLVVSVADAAHGTTQITGGGTEVSYQPDADYCGPDSFTYTITGGSSATVSVTVTCADDAPTAVDDAATVAEDSIANPVNVLGNDSDADIGPKSIESVTQPANGAVVITGGGSGLTYEPNANYCNSVAGVPDTFTYTLAPGGSSATVSVTVTCIDDPPVALNDAASTTQGASALAVDVLANDTDIDGGPKSITSVTQPANGTVVITGSGTGLTYQPKVAYCNDGNPLDTFTYTLNGVSTATVSMTVLCDLPPVAMDDAATVAEDSGANSINVLANDTDGGDGGAMLVESVTAPANGSAAVIAGGTAVTYEPNTNYCNDPPGTSPDTFTYTLNGGSTATVSVTVSCVDDLPAAVDDAATVAEDSGATAVDVLANDADIDGGPKSVASVTQPANGAVVITGGGTGLTYQPSANYCNDAGLADVFTYTLNGGSVANVSVTVTCLPDSATAVADSATVEEDSPPTSIDVLGNDQDPDSAGLAVASATDPPNGTVVLTGGSPGAHTGLTYAPDANFCGADSFNYTLVGGSTATVTVTVTCVNDAPVMTVPGAQSVDEDTPLVFSSVSVADVDAGAGTVTVTVTALNGTITPAGGSGATIGGSGTAVATISGTLAQANLALNGLTYLGTANWNSTRGSETVTFEINDQGNTGTGGSLTDVGLVSINVDAMNDAPVAAPQSFSAEANMRINGLAGLLTGASDPDTGDGGYSAVFTVGTTSATNPAGGNILNLNTSAGSFDFDPPPGATGDVTFTYTICDTGNPGPSLCSAPATVTVSVAGPVIWFVDPAFVTNGDGRLSSPFNNLASAAAVDASGHRIFIFSGTVPTASITLNTNEWLIGQGVTGSTFDTLFGITPPAGTIARPTINGARPVVQGNVVVAANDAVRGLNIQPGSGTAGLTGGGSGLVVGEVSVSTANAAAVSLANGGGTLSFTTINANGGANGIVLSTMTGSFTVTGTGGTCTAGNQSGCSGGVIQNMTGADNSGPTPGGTGIALNSAASVSLTRMYIHDHSNYGIRGTAVAGFALDTSVVSGVNGTNAASPFGDGSISFDNLSGTSGLTNSDISGGFGRNIRVDNTTGSLVLTINSNLIHNTSNAQGDDGVLLEVGGGTATLNVTNNTFSAHGGDHVNVSLLGSPVVGFTFTGNLWSGGHPIGLGQGLFVLAATFDAPGAFTYNISNNGTALNPLVGNNSGGAIHVNKGTGSGSFSGTISGNTIGNPAVNGSGSLNASGIDVEAHGTGTHTTLISNNQVRQFHNDGILVLVGEGNVTMNATVTGNTVSNPDASVASLHGLHFNIGTLPTDASQVCLDVRSNVLTNAANEANSGVDLRIRQRQLTTVRLPGYGGANSDNAAVQTFLTTTNANSVTSILASNTVGSGGGGFVNSPGGSPCTQP